jgi:succinate dehydrogenase/fumarate reductase cytochrome b subunit
VGEELDIDFFAGSNASTLYMIQRAGEVNLFYITGCIHAFHGVKVFKLATATLLMPGEKHGNVQVHHFHVNVISALVRHIVYIVLCKSLFHNASGTHCILTDVLHIAYIHCARTVSEPWCTYNSTRLNP